MAYMSQENKKKIHTALKAIIPASWKWSTSVHHHSTIILTISAGPAWLLPKSEYITTYMQLNEYHPDKAYSGENLKLIREILAALNTGNHDNSDVQSDYFDVGWYVRVNIGKWNKPFIVKES